MDGLVVLEGLLVVPCGRVEAGVVGGVEVEGKVKGERERGAGRERVRMQERGREGGRERRKMERIRERRRQGGERRNKE